MREQMIPMHPEDDDILRYLHDALTTPERLKVEEHIGNCEECASRFAGFSRASLLVNQPPIGIDVDRRTRERAQSIIRDRESGWGHSFLNRPKFRLVFAGSLLFAISLSVYFLFPAKEEPQFRSEGSTELHTLSLFPADGSVVTNQRSPFRWTSLGASMVYRFSILEASGEVLWKTDTGDTTIVLPESVVLQPGKTYLWRVETTLADKKLERSSLHVFTYSPE